tara:strand:+ start:466 stop:1374 length:909 start_codon:yes stop_codon:yes gene_type:complete
MNIQTVGMENLPNVFIEEIFIYLSEDPLARDFGQRIVVRLNMYDHDPNPSWRRSEMSDLKVKVAFITDDSRSSLNNGETSLYNYPPKFYGDRHDTAAVSNTVFVIGAQEFIPTGMKENGVHKYKKTIEVTMNQPENLNVYVACFIDGLNLGNDLLNKFYGPMSGEKIYIGGDVNKESHYFYYPDSNEEYGGPVHVHQQTWMEGSQHSSNPHEELLLVSEPNFKISVIDSIVDPNEFVNEPEPESGAGNQWEKEALAGIPDSIPNLADMAPLEEIEEDPDTGNNPGSNFDPDETGQGGPGGGY